MSEPKSPTPGDNKPTTDELFDRNYLSDSDSEFLAELDRVLTSESDETCIPSQPPESGQDEEIAIDTEDTVEALGMVDGDEPGFDLAEEENPPDLPSPSPDGPEQSQAPVTEDLVEVNEPVVMDEPVDELKTTESLAIDNELATDIDTDLSAGADELDWNYIPGESEETATPPSFEQTYSEEMQQAEAPPPMDDEFPANNGRENDEEPETPAAPIAPEPEPMATIKETPDSGEHRGAAPIHDKPAPGGDGGAMWSGASALLGLLGLAAGGSGLWMANDMGSRLAHLESSPTTHTTPLASVARQADPTPMPAADDTRLSDLEQTAQRLDNDLAAMAAELKNVLDDRDQRMSEMLDDVQSGLNSLQQQFQGISANIATLDHPRQQVPEPPASPPAATVKAAGTETTQQGARMVEKQTHAAAKTAPKPEAKSKPTTGHGWSVNLQSFQHASKAEAARKCLNADGIPAEVSETSSKGKTWYRVKVSGFAAFDQAKAYAEGIRSKPGLSSAWIGRD